MQLGQTSKRIGRWQQRDVFLLAGLWTAVLIVAMIFIGLLRSSDTPLITPTPKIEGVVTDAYTGEPLAGLKLTFGAQQITTDARGEFTLKPGDAPMTLRVPASDGYTGIEHEIAPGDTRGLTIILRPTSLSGTVVDAKTGQPLPGITLKAVGADGTASSEAATGPDGRYTLRNVPAGARLIAEGPGFSRQELEIGQRTALDLTLRADVIAGTVRAKDGKPIAGATVAAGSATTTTGADGAYTLNGIAENVPVVAKARGYQPRQQQPEAAPTLDFTLEPLVVKGIYLSPDSIGNDEKFNALLALADRTEINAMVLDFKDETGWLHHDSQVQAAKAIGAVHPSYDLAARLKTLKEHNIYTIARVVCFLDQTLATKRPELAVHNVNTGGIWTNDNGAAWVSAMKPEAWEYNAAIAVEAAQMGFDEIQYDYVRFPTDGDTEAMDLGAPSTMETRTDAIGNFLKLTREKLAPYGAALGVDIFGIALFDKTDYDGIGQLLEKIAPHVDYICPMVYPSHYIPGALGLDVPNDHPYEVILGSLQRGAGRIPNPTVMFRPWLQDFSYGAGIDYGPNEIRAQIQATYDFGATGWMFWNAANVYTEAGFLPEGR